MRRLIRDEPVWFSDSLPTDGTTGTLLAGSKPFRLQRAPVYNNSALNQSNAITAAGVVMVVVYDVAPASTAQVEIVTETGELIFQNGAAPATGTLSAIYQAVRFTDTQIHDALYDGLDLMWPEIYDPQIDTTSIVLSMTQLEYALPAAFQDPRVVLQGVEYNPPGPWTHYRRIGAWRQINSDSAPLLVLDKVYPPGSTCRLTYAVPYSSVVAPNANPLGNLPTAAAFLPVYYAVARLLMDQEVMRLRADDLPALTGETAQQPSGQNTATADYWFGRFSQALDKLSLDLPARRMVRGRAAERLGLSGFWQAA